MTVLRVGWIGTGVMGAAMCGHLLRAGHPVAVYTRTRAKADSLLALGAVWQPSPCAVAADSDVVFSMVGGPADVEEVLLGSAGALACASPGSTLVDMTTSEPALARRIHAAAAARGVHALDAPVSGGDIGAREATLAIMVGGDPAAFDAVRPLLERLGRTIVRMGPAGAGQHTKLGNQILVASTMVGVVECLLYAHRAGLDAERLIAIVGSGAASSWAINNLGPRITRGDFAPGFLIRHFVKDMGIALAESKRMNLTLPGLSRAYEFYARAVSMGLADRGTQALYLVLTDMNGEPG